MIFVAMLLVPGSADAQDALKVVRVSPPRIVVNIHWNEPELAANPVLSFAVYRQELDREPLWSAVQTVKPLGGGWYRVAIGLGAEDAGPAAALNDQKLLWLEIEGTRPAVRLPLRAPSSRRSKPRFR